jgi:hypothetical protein
MYPEALNKILNWTIFPLYFNALQDSLYPERFDLTGINQIFAAFSKKSYIIMACAQYLNI